MSAAADKVSVLAVLRHNAHEATKKYGPDNQDAAALAAIAALIAAGHRADGDQREGRPERGPGFSDAEWALYLRGWDSHAEAVYRSGLRAALTRVGDAS